MKQIISGLGTTNNPNFILNYIVAYCGPRFYPLLASATVISYYTTDLKQFVSYEVAYKYIAFRVITFFMSSLMFLLLEAFGNYVRLAFSSTISSVFHLTDVFTGGLLKLIVDAGGEWFYRVMYMVRLNILATAIVYLLEDMIFMNSNVLDVNDAKDLFFLGNSYNLNVPVARVSGASLWCTTPSQFHFTRGNLGDFPHESVANKVRGIIFALLTGYNPYPLTITDAPKNSLTPWTIAKGATYLGISSAVFGVQGPTGGIALGTLGLYAADWFFNISNTIQICFFPTLVNFLLLFSGFGPAAQIYSQIMQYSINSSIDASQLTELNHDAYTGTFSKKIITALGISSGESYYQWLSYICKLVGLPLTGPLIEQNQIFMQSIINQATFLVILNNTNFQTKETKIIIESNDTTSAYQKLYDQIPNAQAQLSAYVSIIENGIVDRLHQVFNYNTIHSLRYVFSALGYNLVFLDHYKSSGDNYIGDKQMSELLWFGDPYLVNRMANKGLYIGYPNVTLNSTKKNQIVWSNGSKIKIILSLSGLSLQI